MRLVRYVYSLQAMSMGFAVESFKEALKRCHGDVEKAFKAAGDKLLMNKFIRQNLVEVVR